MIALFDRDDAHHTAVRGLLRDSAGRLITTWPVVTEASHMLDFDPRAQLDFYRWVAAGVVVAAEAIGIQEIVSLDRDFEIYRIAGRERFVNLYPTNG